MLKTGRAQVDGNWAGGWLGEVLIGEHGVFEDAGADCQGAKAQAPSPTNREATAKESRADLTPYSLIGEVLIG